MALKDVYVPAGTKKIPKKTVTVEARLVDLMRKIARADGIRLGELLERAIRAYVRENHSDWELVEDDARARATLVPVAPPSGLRQKAEAGGTEP